MGADARDAMPSIAQVFLAARPEQGAPPTRLDLDRQAYRLRKRAEHAARDNGWSLYFPSLSARTFVYKGMLTPQQLTTFYSDLTDSRLVSAIALVHSRFSTNTFPSWPLAHPYRYLAHNGEFNTIRGNRNWMTAREALLASEAIDGELSDLFPICDPDGSDSASFDQVVELLHLAGRSLPHAMLMTIPPAWENHDDLPEAWRAFHRFHAGLTEPWDGPACVAFTDGELIGAMLDRNGFRPARWCRTRGGVVVLSSEAGVLDLDPADVVGKGRVEPGRMFVIDTQLGRIVPDAELKDTLAAQHPYAAWLKAGIVEIPTEPAAVDEETVVREAEELLREQGCFGYTEEEHKLSLLPMALSGAEPLTSMGTDTPVAVLSERPRLLFDYFVQQFAQVTNPPLDSIREGLVTSLTATIGPEENLLEVGPASCRRIDAASPVLDNNAWDRLFSTNVVSGKPRFAVERLVGLYPVRDGEAGLRRRLAEICERAAAAVRAGVQLLVLSDRDGTAELAPIPSLLLTSAVHHHLVRERCRARTGLVVESGDCRSTHHAALLVGFGAAAINPYLACDVVARAARDGALGDLSETQAARNYARALNQGVLKIMSKMGISTVASYRGAQAFEAIGLNHDVIERYFPYTPGRIDGVGLDVFAAEVAARHAAAWRAHRPDQLHRRLEVGGEYQWRREGEIHLFNPETVFLLQHATRSKQYDVFARYTAAVDDLARRTGSLRGLFELRPGSGPAVPLEEVEPVESILRRFATGAMSYGAISAEAHETLAIAMNRLGGRSNSGEGGEESERLGDPTRRSKVKQVASGRFGVTSEYLVDAEEIQIKVAQGAKPGE
ncbi:MAG: glutamate synthase central domain-containing protein, partial [Mycobacteriales bacterium]